MSRAFRRITARRRSRGTGGAAAVALALAALPMGAQAEDSALESGATRLVNFETANMLPAGTWSLQVGSHQTSFDVGGGTGSQLYYTAIDWAATDNLLIGFSTQVQDDALVEPILGMTPPTRFLSVGFSAKYRFYDSDTVDVAAQASVEALSFRTALFGTDVTGATNVVGSLHLPVTWQAGPALQLHFTPGVSFLPDDLNGIPYYGTVATVGAGATWQASERMQVFAALNMPVSGGNTIDTARNITDELVYTAGARYAFTPKVALEGYVTNALGISPATGIVTYYPDGDEMLYGIKLHYTPNARYDSTYRRQPLNPASARDLQLQNDGFILSSAGVVEPGAGRAAFSGGDQDHWSGALAFSPDRDFQLDAIAEDYSIDGSVPAALVPTPGKARWMLGGRIRVLDQSNGDPVSFSLRVLGGRDFEDQDVGALYVAAPITWEASDRLALTVQPAGGAFGNTEVIGLGLGANYEVSDGLQLIGEVTPVSDANGTVWAAGARYTAPSGMFSVDLSATNAIGRNGYGTLIAQDDTRYSLGVSLTTDIFKR